MLEKACLSDFEDESSSNDDDDYDDLLRDSPVLKGVNAKIRKKIADKIEQGEVSSFAPGQKFAEEMITAVVKEAHEEQKKERQRKHAVLTPPPPLPPPPPPPTWPPPPLPLEMDTSAVRGVLSTSKDLAAVADDEMKKVPEEVRDRAMREREKHAALIKRVDDAYEKFRKAIHGENLPKLPGPKGFPSFHACRDGLLASIDREPEPLEDVLSRMEGVEKALPKIVISDCGTPEPSQTDETMPEPMGHRRTPEGVKVMEAKRRLNRSHMERVSQAHEKFHDALLDSDGPDAGVDYNDDCFLRQ